MLSQDRRSVKSDEELYAARDIQSFIEKERRHDELDRFREVREQKRIWRAVYYSCVFMNLVFIGCAILGAHLYE